MDRIDTIIFDLDGTLIDSLPDIAQAMNRALERHRLVPQPAAAYRGLIGNGMRAMVDRLAPHFTRTHREALYEDFSHFYGRDLFTRTRLYPGIAELVPALRRAGFTLALLSNKRQDLVHRLVEHFFAPGDFAAVKGHLDGAPGKPDPAPTRALLRDLSAAPHRCVLIGDTPVDMATASAVNATALGVAWGYRTPEALLAAGATDIVYRAENIVAWLARQTANRESAARAPDRAAQLNH